MMLDPKPSCISAIQEARSFLMGCRLHRTVLGEQIIGFPEIKGKERITEWGGTSSAIAVLLGDVQYIPLEEIADINRAVEWLISRQTNGAWEASGMPCAEATAGVAYDLLLVGKLSAIAQGNAVNFLSRCYRDGYFVSTPNYIGQPHIYTTYIVTKFFSKIAIDFEKDAIRQWVKGMQLPNGRWGASRNGGNETISHTVLALNILANTGKTWAEIENDYPEQIAWILKNYRANRYESEELHIPTNSLDRAGQLYTRLSLRLFELPRVGELAINIGDSVTAARVQRSLLNQQYQGGWGPSKNELTMWATQQSVDFLLRFKLEIIPRLKLWTLFHSYFSDNKYFSIRLIIFMVGLILTFFFLFIPEYRANLIVSLFMLVLAWAAPWRNDS